MARFRDEVAVQHDLELPDYQALWAWSVDDLEGFWSSIADFFDLDIDGDRVLTDATMPGATWFPGAEVSFAREVFRRADPARPALVALDETGTAVTWDWDRLARASQAVAGWLLARGVVPGDRVVGYLGNTAEAVVAFLATASIGATWAVCNQDVTAEGAASRFAQLSPKVLVTARSAVYGGRSLDRSEAISDLSARLPSLSAALVVGDASWDEAVAWERPLDGFVDVPFDHPLWVLFSSGTTGAPKGLVHGHGGTLLQQCAALGLHLDLQPGDRFLWYSSTSWVMWNLQVACLLVGATAVLYDGSPTHPDAAAVWRLAAEHGVTHLGVSPGLLAAAKREHVDVQVPGLRVLGVTGAPLTAELAQWARDRFGAPLNVLSGGTDVATAFVGGNPLDPEPAPGTMGAPWLGVAAAAVDDLGRPVVGQVGELVVTRPMPSMPVYLWSDPDSTLYRETYFSTFPAIWRQGDWATFTRHPAGYVTVEVHGRSDATLNRNGIRFGTSEIYAAVESMSEVAEALVVGIDRTDGSYWMPMLVHLQPGHVLDDDLLDRMRAAIRSGASPRHVPDTCIQVPALPHTLTGKRLEVPVKRLLGGARVEDVVAASAVDRPELLHLIAELAGASASSS